MNDGNESNNALQRFPDEIHGLVMDADICFAVDRAVNLGHFAFLFADRFEFDFLAVDLRSAGMFLNWVFNAAIGHRIIADTGHDMSAILDEAQRNSLAGIVGVRDEVEGLADSDHLHERDHLVGKLAFGAIGEHKTFVDAHRKRNSEGACSRPDDNGYGLTGMSHNVFRLGVAVRFLVQKFDGWHLFARLGYLDAV